VTACALILVATVSFGAAEPVRYRFSFPEAQHHWMQVEATFADLPAAPLELRMSRASPGRYSLHDFAKNVYDVHVAGPDGRELATERPDPYGWTVPTHGDRVTVKYKVFGDRVDGTYLGVDATHAHVNMPAAVMWARGFDDRPATIAFERPPGKEWRVATQLHPGASPFEFSAPNLQYLMDSPAEFGPITMREFVVGASRFRVALHHTGTDADADSIVKDVEKIVRQEGAIYGEFPAYEPGYYTFLTDLLPYAHGDGMEHRNSTVITGSMTIAGGRGDVLDLFAHEFFHGWNVERIRPRGLEPFDFERANLSSELWLAEGFTQYYGPLTLQRARLVDIASTAGTLTYLIESVTSPAHLVRSAEEMSRMAAFTDGGHPVDPTNWSTTVISYYPFGGAIALALDLTLRTRSDNRVSLDDYMRAMWRRHGKSAAREGLVDRPYTAADAEAALAEVAGDAVFARGFFARYIQGHDVADYAKLLAAAGFTVKPRNPGRAWLGDLQFDGRNGLRIASLVAPVWPIYAAGIDEGDLLQEIDGRRVSSEADIAAALQRRKPGDIVTIGFVDRGGAAQRGRATLKADPHVEVISNDAALTPAQKQFRERWLGPKTAER
jgi:predicted metalloprotease with PDZ domain